MKNILIIKLQIILLLSITPFIYSQTIYGVVVDDNNHPIKYAHIGALSGNYGTISNDSGKYSLDFSSLDNKDTIIFSCLGFQPKHFSVQEILNKCYDTVQLKKTSYNISKVEISPQPKKLVKFGRKKKHLNGFLYGDFGKGQELARFFNNSKSLKLIKFEFHISLNHFDSLTFRINFYSDKNGKPYEVVNKEPIYVKTQVKKGWVKCNLSGYGLTISEDFYVSLEGIEGWGNDEIISQPIPHLNLSGKHYRKKNYLYIRRHSHGFWTKKAGVKMDYYLEAY